MAKKKQKAVKRKFAAKKTVSLEVPQGFFQRLKDVLPEQKKETVRVKTFIVEKPVYVSAPERRISAPREKYNLDEDSPKIDSRKSRYLKRKEERDEEVSPEDMDDKELDEQDSKDYAEGEYPQEELGELDETSEEGLTDEENNMVDTEEEIETTKQSAKGHTRSNAMFQNIWWKKALFWAILVWLLILAVSMAMQAAKLVQVDLTRQWWILLGGIIVVSMIYFKFFDKKI